MKNLSIASVIEKNKLASNQPWMAAMEIDVRDSDDNHIEFIRVIRNSENSIIDGEVYQAFPFDIEVTESQGAVPAITVTIKDTTRIVQAYMMNYNGGIGFKVVFRIVTGTDSNDLTIDTDLEETFYVVDASTSDYVVNWQLGVFNPLRLAVPGRIQRRNICSFGFKTPECAYVGADTTCSRTLDGANGCRAKSNSQNFGGFPGIQPRF